jgi:hypothetical protein
MKLRFSRPVYFLFNQILKVYSLEYTEIIDVIFTTHQWW